jgi:succinoglycan biosynthesis protein ExoM
MSERVVIAIPTYKRPLSLKRLLDAIARLDTRHDVAVLVADNDCEKQDGLALCHRLAPSYRWPLAAVPAPERGIAQVRNVLVEHALRDRRCAFVAMIDDDEWPDAGWLDEFVAVQRRTGADVLQGSILFEQDGPQNDPAPVPDIRHPTGLIAMLQGAGNILIVRAVLEELPRPWFDPDFALTGGEDFEFFTRLAKAGKRFAWADGARAYGEVPATRRELAWILARAYSTGNSDMRVWLKHEGGLLPLLRESAKIAGAVLLSLPLALILAPSPNHRRRPLQKLFRAAGKAAAIAGQTFNEYSLVHGE